jgi:hypothetical protein
VRTGNGQDCCWGGQPVICLRVCTYTHTLWEGVASEHPSYDSGCESHRRPLLCLQLLTWHTGHPSRPRAQPQSHCRAQEGWGLGKVTGWAMGAPAYPESHIALCRTLTWPAC